MAEYRGKKKRPKRNKFRPAEDAIDSIGGHNFRSGQNMKKEAINNLAKKLVNRRKNASSGKR